MYALLKDGMEIKEGDEHWHEEHFEWYKFPIEKFPRVFSDTYYSVIRRKLSTMAEVEEFFKECENA